MFLRGDGMKWNDEKYAVQHMIFIVIIITMSDKKRWQFMTTMEVRHFNLYNNNI